MSTLSRRDLFKAPAGIALATQVVRAEHPFVATEINHIAVCVSDVKKSAAFYQSLCGSPARRLRTGTLLFEFGLSELVIGSLPGRPLGIDHFCVAVKDFSLEGASGKVKQLGLKPESLYAADELYFRDPDGILVQLSEPNYHNPRAEVLPKPSTPPPSLFRPLVLNHLALHVSDMARSTAFYERLFGPAQRQPDRELAGFRTQSGQVVGWGTGLVNPVGVDHFCISIEGYEPEAVNEKLRGHGIASQRLYRPDQVFVRDPDGVLVQFAGPDGGVRRARRRRGSIGFPRAAGQSRGGAPMERRSFTLRWMENWWR